MSWDEQFAERYDEWSADMTADIPFYVELAREAEGLLVELAVGNGSRRDTGRQGDRPKHARYRHLAVDARAGARACKSGGRGARAARGRHARSRGRRAGRADLCPFRGRLHLHTWRDRRRTFERVAASLRPGGRFAWNAFAFDHAIAARLDGRHQDEPVPHALNYAVGENRIDIVLGEGGRSSVWWATKNEWLGLIDVAELEVEALYGGFEREPFDDDSREYVWVARRPA